MKLIKYNKAFEYFCEEEQKMKWSFDNRITDSKRLDVDWSTLVIWLMDGHDVNDRHKNEQPMLSVTDYRAANENESFVFKRANNILSQEALVLDYDDGSTIQDFKDEYGKYEWVAYTTYSHSKELMKFRVILPLDNPITNKQIKERQDGFREEFKSADKTSFDVGRSFFVPSCPTNTADVAETWWNEGELYNWDHIKVKEIIEPEVKKIVRSGVSGKDNPGKILFDTLDIVQFFKDVGLYKKSVGGGKHEVGCPWEVEHTSSADTGTAIWTEGSNGTPTFFCVHRSHGKKTLFDVTNKYKEQYGYDFMRQFYDVEPLSYEVRQEIKEIEQRIAELKEKQK